MEHVDFTQYRKDIDLDLLSHISREQLIEELRLTRRLYTALDAIIENSKDGFFVTDGNGYIIKVNKSYEELSGANRDDLVGKNVHDLEDSLISESASLMVLKTGKPVTIEQNFYKTHRTAYITSSPIYDQHGEIMMVVSNNRDFEEIDQLRAQLSQTRALASEYQSRMNAIREQLYQKPDIVAEDPKMLEVLYRANKVAPTDSTVLITGETGTGKEEIAKFLHENSARAKNAFIKVNCPSLSSNLFESEMFGYAKGAFTGAYTSRIGRVEAAHNGTLFLDEIGELAPDMQSKLLQVMEESCFERVGETRARHVDIRIITATNIDTRRAMETGTLRRDLFYRIASVILRMPPLRERRNDISMLVNYFIRQFSQHWKLQTPKLSQNILSILSAYDWPGNIRQLRNIVSRLLLRSLDGPVDEKFINKLLWEKNRPTTEDGIASKEEKICGGEKSFPSLEEYERTHILEALRRTGGRLSGPSGAATLLGIPRSTLQHRMRKLGIHS